MSTFHCYLRKYPIANNIIPIMVIGIVRESKTGCSAKARKIPKITAKTKKPHPPWISRRDILILLSIYYLTHFTNWIEKTKAPLVRSWHDNRDRRAPLPIPTQGPFLRHCQISSYTHLFSMVVQIAVSPFSDASIQCIFYPRVGESLMKLGYPTMFLGAKAGTRRNQ